MRFKFLLVLFIIFIIPTSYQAHIQIKGQDNPIEQYYSIIDKQDNVTIRSANGDVCFVDSSDVLSILTKYSSKVKQDNQIIYFTKGIQISVLVSNKIVFEHNGMGTCRVKYGLDYILCTAPNEMYNELLELLNK